MCFPSVKSEDLSQPESQRLVAAENPKHTAVFHVLERVARRPHLLWTVGIRGRRKHQRACLLHCRACGVLPRLAHVACCCSNFMCCEKNAPVTHRF